MPRRLPLLCLSVLLASAIQAQDQRELLTRFWLVESAQQHQQARAALEAATDLDELLRLLEIGPQYRQDVPRGVVGRVRRAGDGREFPYVLLIPESYSPEQAYPVEFMLHGGVGRPLRPKNEPFWRGGYDSLRQEDRLVVVPAGWSEAYWWQDSQADNMKAILRRLKRDYHVDDNRVSLTGVSDGGTGAYFFAFKQPTDWASFFPFIGHPAVLRNPQSNGGHRLYFENLLNKPLYIVNGEVDRLYPAESLQPFVQLLQEVGVVHEFRAITGGGHNTQWLPEEKPAIERFKQAHPRDPLPERLNWISDRVDRYSRNHWLRIDELKQAGTPGIFSVSRDGNTFTATADDVSRFTLLLHPDEVNLGEPVNVIVNGESVYSGRVEPSVATVLDWLEQDWDRSMTFAADLTIELD